MDNAAAVDQRSAAGSSNTSGSGSRVGSLAGRGLNGVGKWAKGWRDDIRAVSSVNPYELQHANGPASASRAPPPQQKGPAKGPANIQAPRPPQPQPHLQAHQPPPAVPDGPIGEPARPPKPQPHAQAQPHAHHAVAAPAAVMPPPPVQAPAVAAPAPVPAVPQVVTYAQPQVVAAQELPAQGPTVLASPISLHASPIRAQAGPFAAAGPSVPSPAPPPELTYEQQLLHARIHALEAALEALKAGLMVPPPTPISPPQAAAPPPPPVPEAPPVQQQAPPVGVPEPAIGAPAAPVVLAAAGVLALPPQPREALPAAAPPAVPAARFSIAQPSLQPPQPVPAAAAVQQQPPVHAPQAPVAQPVQQPAPPHADEQHNNVAIGQPPAPPAQPLSAKARGKQPDRRRRGSEGHESLASSTQRFRVRRPDSEAGSIASTSTGAASISSKAVGGIGKWAKGWRDDLRSLHGVNPYDLGKATEDVKGKAKESVSPVGSGIGHCGSMDWHGRSTATLQSLEPRVSIDRQVSHEQRPAPVGAAPALPSIANSVFENFVPEAEPAPVPKPMTPTVPQVVVRPARQPIAVVIPAAGSSGSSGSSTSFATPNGSPVIAPVVPTVVRSPSRISPTRVVPPAPGPPPAGPPPPVPVAAAAARSPVGEHPPGGPRQGAPRGPAQRAAPPRQVAALAAPAPPAAPPQPVPPQAAPPQAGPPQPAPPQPAPPQPAPPQPAPPQKAPHQVQVQQRELQRPRMPEPLLLVPQQAPQLPPLPPSSPLGATHMPLPPPPTKAQRVEPAPPIDAELRRVATAMSGSAPSVSDDTSSFESGGKKGIGASVASGVGKWAKGWRDDLRSLHGVSPYDIQHANAPARPAGATSASGSGATPGSRGSSSDVAAAGPSRPVIQADAGPSRARNGSVDAPPPVPPKKQTGLVVARVERPLGSMDQDDAAQMLATFPKPPEPVPAAVVRHAAAAPAPPPAPALAYASPAPSSPASDASPRIGPRPLPNAPGSNGPGIPLHMRQGIRGPRPAFPAAGPSSVSPPPAPQAGPSRIPANGQAAAGPSRPSPPPAVEAGPSRIPAAAAAVAAAREPEPEFLIPERTFRGGLNDVLPPNARIAPVRPRHAGRSVATFGAQALADSNGNGHPSGSRVTIDTAAAPSAATVTPARRKIVIPMVPAPAYSEIAGDDERRLEDDDHSALRANIPSRPATPEIPTPVSVRSMAPPYASQDEVPAYGHAY